MSNFPWTIFWILLAAGLVGTALMLPYAFALQLKPGSDGKPLTTKNGKPLPPTWVMALASLLQSGVLLAGATFFGLLAAGRLGLGLPVLQAALQGQPLTGLIGVRLLVAVIAGVGGTLGLILLERFVFLPRVSKALTGSDTRISLWKRFLAGFYGGIAEEILLRLFMMSGLAWLISLVWKDATAALWLANVLAAVLFGLGHLPATRAITPLTPMVVIRALALNGLLGIVLGYLYMRYGLETAMFAHFTADVVIHVIYPQVAPKDAADQPQVQAV